MLGGPDPSPSSLAEDRMLSLAEKYHQRIADPFAPIAVSHPTLP